jgi:2-polyprenyl-3-methyl-5-hydroxy-6-metoxy-1,4-benzoquinol methylase
VSPVRKYLESFYGSQKQPIEFEYLLGAMYVLYECKKCGLIYQAEIPNEFLMEKLYGHWLDPEISVAAKAMSRRDLNYHVNDAGEVMMLIAYFGGNPSRLHFLDHGMGWGSWALMAKAFGCHAYGTEISQTKLEYCSSQGIEVIQWQDLEKHKFDFINTEQLFEHISEPLATLRQLKKALKPNGLIKISVPDGTDTKRRLKVGDWTAVKYSKNSLNAISPLEHVNCFSRTTVIKMAEIAGLKEVRIALTLQYIYWVNWKPIKPLIYTMLRPFRLNVLRKGTNLFFRHEQ